jgi:hypothetical protein
VSFDRAWHFLRLRDGVPVLRDGVTPAPALGEWLEHTGAVVPCQSGLHASRRVIDALEFCDWEGAVACLVEVDGGIVEHGSKLVCRRRRIIAIADADDVMRTFAREQALLVIHLWDAPPVVREYLETGREDLRAAARAAAWAAARDAASAAAWAAARDAASAAAWAAARDAASAAARDAASGRCQGRCQGRCLRSPRIDVPR